MATTLKGFVEKRLEDTGRNPFQAAKIGGLERSFVNDILIDKKMGVLQKSLPKLALALDCSVEDLNKLVNGSEAQKHRRIPLSGYVGAGARAILFTEADAPEDTVSAPDNATDRTRAFEIRGDSLGELFDRWIVYIEDTPQTFRSLVGHICMVELTDGRRLVKKVVKGQLPKRFTLLSNTEQPIYDAELTWGARVTDMRPQ